MTPLRRLAFAFAFALAAAGAAHAADAPRASTANARVHVLAPMPIPGLGRERTIRVYLPPGYETSGQRYPVLYLQDGQNLFDDATSFVGEWGVDEALDALAAEGLPVIAVGIDHGGDTRLNELSPWPNAKYGPAEGIAYLEFLAHTLKPAIDAAYRTLPDRDHTLVGGSSMGALMAHYAIEKYPGVYGKALEFSPSFWYGGEAAFDYTFGRCLPAGTRIYLVTGGEEGDEALGDLRRMTSVLAGNASPGVAVHSEVRPGAKHNETFWRQEFPQAVRWLFADAPTR
jgi:predicted alpha/beta superfamily hydrolase